MIIIGVKRTKNEPHLSNLSYNKSEGSTARENRFTEGVSITEPTRIAPYEQAFGNQYSQLANLYGSRVAAPLNLERADIFSSTMDPIVQNTLSRGIQDIKAKEAAAQRGVSANLSVAGTGENTALLNALNRQAAIASSGAMNALYPSALEQQRAFDVQRQSIINARNQEALAARQQLINELGGGMNLLNTLIQMTQTAKGERTKKIESSEGEGGGEKSRSFF